MHPNEKNDGKESTVGMENNEKTVFDMNQYQQYIFNSLITIVRI